MRFNATKIYLKKCLGVLIAMKGIGCYSNDVAFCEASSVEQPNFQTGGGYGRSGSSFRTCLV